MKSCGCAGISASEYNCYAFSIKEGARGLKALCQKLYVRWANCERAEILNKFPSKTASNITFFPVLIEM